MTHPWIRLALPFAAIAVLTGCSTVSSPVPSDAIASSALETTPTLTDKTADGTTIQAFMMRGMVILGHESNSIQPCGSSQQYWLTTPISDREALAQITPRGYQAMYAEVIGYLEPAPTQGFAADYDGRFNTKQINLISAEMSDGCKQPPHTTRAFGNEPGWAAEIKDSQVTLLQIGQDRQSQAITSQSAVAGKQQYHGKGFDLSLTQAQCNDTMSDTLFGWRSVLQWQGKRYQGCATLGATDVTQHWAGQYRSKSQGTSGLTTIVTLNPDHSAITTYDYQNEDPSIVETGFWQQAGENTVQVMMTEHQGRRLNSERLFTLTGRHLSVYEERINGQTYSLGREGLQLDKQ